MMTYELTIRGAKTSDEFKEKVEKNLRQIAGKDVKFLQDCGIKPPKFEINVNGRTALVRINETAD